MPNIGLNPVGVVIAAISKAQPTMRTALQTISASSARTLWPLRLSYGWRLVSRALTRRLAAASTLTLLNMPAHDAKYPFSVETKGPQKVRRKAPALHHAARKKATRCCGRIVPRRPMRQIGLVRKAGENLKTSSAATHAANDTRPTASAYADCA